MHYATATLTSKGGARLGLDRQQRAAVLLSQAVWGQCPVRAEVPTAFSEGQQAIMRPSPPLAAAHLLNLLFIGLDTVTQF